MLNGHASPRPPVLFIHGAANSSSVWTFWQQEVARRGWPSFAVDLQGHGQSTGADLATVGMKEYADDVRAVVVQLRQPPVLIGWSMGGLVAMMAATTLPVAAIVAIAPSTPARQVDGSLPLRPGVFGPE